MAVDQEIRVLGDENVIVNPKNSQKNYPLTFKAQSNVIVYGRKKNNLNFTVPISSEKDYTLSLGKDEIVFSDTFNLEEFGYILIKNPFEEISDFFKISSLEELSPDGEEFNKFNDEVVKWLRRITKLLSDRCMIFETTLFKNINNFPNIPVGHVFVREVDGWTSMPITDAEGALKELIREYAELMKTSIKEFVTNIEIPRITQHTDKEIERVTVKGNEEIGLIEDFAVEKKQEITQHTNEEIDRINLTGISNKLTKADTIAKLKTMDLKQGDVVEVLGYYNADDGATHKRVIDQADDRSGVQLANGLWANIIVDLDYTDITWFGAKRDENRGASPITTQAFKKALNYGKNVFIPEGNFWIDEPLFINVEKQWLKGSSSRSVILATNVFPKDDFMLTFYSNNGDFYSRNKREQKHGMFKLHGKTDETGAIVNGFRTSGVRGTDKEGHVDCQIYENIIGEYLNVFIEYGSHVYRCTFHQVDGNIVKYFVKSAKNQFDAGEVTTFLNCGIWGGLIHLTHSCKFISCTIHLNATQEVDGVRCGHYLAESDYEFTNCHFEAILYSQQEYDEIRQNRFFIKNGYLNFTECDGVITGNYMTIDNAFFLTQNTSDTSTWVNINGGHWQYLFERLKGNFVLVKGQGKISNIKQKLYYSGNRYVPKRYGWTKESFKTNKEYVYYGGFSKDIVTKNVENLEDGSVTFKIVRSKSSNSNCGVYKSINVSNNVNVRYVLEVELNTVGLQAQITDYDYSLIALDKDDNVINFNFNSTNESYYSQLTSTQIGDTFTIEQVFDLPMGTETLLYGVGINSNLLNVDFKVKKCYVELI